MLILSTANRLQNVSVLIRQILKTDNHVYEQNLAVLVKRVKLYHRALVCFYLAVGLLALAALIGSADLLFPSINIVDLLPTNLFVTVGIMFVIFGTSYLIIESVVNTRIIVGCKKTQDCIERAGNQQSR